MAAELVACPHCDGETWVIVPVGQKLVKIATGPLALGRGNHNQKTTCRECIKQFYVKTGEPTAPNRSWDS